MLMLFIGYELIIIGCCLVFHESMDVILGGVDMILAHREKDVVDLLMQGYTHKKIALCLRISDFTVRDHVSSLLFK